MYLGIDLGTSSVKTVLMDENQTVVASSTADMEVSRPDTGWSEQDPAAWIRGIESTLDELKSNHAKSMNGVRGIGLSGHMHGATLLDKHDEVLRPCILWNDTRSHAQAERLDTPTSRSLCGNILFPGFTAPKLAWTAENEPDTFSKVAKVLLPKDYARLWLTGEHVSEMSDAAGTGWLDVSSRTWSEELLEATQLSTSNMPSLVEGTAVSGTIRPEIASRFGLTESVVVAGGAGDNAASACGMGTVAPGNAFLSLGTSGVLFAANASYQPNAQSAVHTFCHALPNTWHQMGVILAATDSLNWLATVLGKSPSELTAALDGTEATPTQVLFLPYLGGERTPHNDASIRGVFAGLSHDTDSIAMTKAVLQGVAFAFRDSQNALASAGTELENAYAIGGGSKSAYWLQLIASALKLPLSTTVDGDYGAGLGAARLGMIAAENADAAQVCQKPPISQTIEPEIALFDHFSREFERYQQAYNAIKQMPDSV
ncbi:MAG: xylulokinase [Gammaproteobacteria bacterium]|nr:xylulokinase [Gammaproteobacteria bacterium]